MQQPVVLPDALPSTRTLARASLASVGLAALLSAGVVLPAETGRDPIGLGAVLGLTEMGRIKVSLAAEAAQDAEHERLATATNDDSTLAAVGQAKRWRDSMTVTLAPDKGIELKLAMRKDEKATYEWKTDASPVYYNTHGEPPNPPKGFSAHSYSKGTATGDQGTLVAVYDGMHGWFWRNRTDKPIRITLKTGGEYLVLKEMK
jgi:hypothetical protein